MDMMEKRGIKMLAPEEVKKKFIPVATTNQESGFWCVKHQHWASTVNGIGWKNGECHTAQSKISSEINII